MPEAPPFDTLLEVSGGYCVARCLHCVADLGVADRLGDAPQSAEALAAATGAQVGALHRVLRLLVAHGIFEMADGLYRHNPASRLLRDDHPQSMRSLVRMFGLSGLWATMGELGHSISTGEPAADKALGGLWNYFSTHPDAGRIFDQAMTAKAHGQVAGVIGAYDFMGFDRIGDIGGGRGHLLEAVLRAAPRASGVLFDLPQVIEQVKGKATDRLRLQSGDFFKDLLPTCDVYLIMEVIHDWGDDESAAILRAIRRSAPTLAKLLLIEALIPDDLGPSWPKMLDMWMLCLGGRQRTQVEYAKLLGDSGWKFVREIATNGGVSILEAVPASAG